MEMEEEIRQQLLTGKLKDYGHLPVVLVSMEDVDDIRFDLLYTPIRTNWAGCECILIIVKRWMFVYNLSPDKKPLLSKHTLTECGKVEIVRFGHESGLVLINILTGYEGNIRSSAFRDLNNNKTPGIHD